MIHEAQIAYRSDLYASSARQAYERAQARAWGVPTDKLEAYPGDGQTECGTKCACGWVFEEVMEDGELVGWNCTWELDYQRVVEQHCGDCPTNAAKWNPLFVPVD